VYVQTLGVLLPYQINFRGLPILAVAEGELTPADYGNFVPRYSPLISQPRQLLERFQRLPQSFAGNPYGVELREGFGLPFWLGDGTAWRDIESTAALSWKTDLPVSTIDLRFTNIIMAESTSSARIVLKQNERELATLEVPVQTEKTISVSPLEGLDHLVIEKSYLATEAANQVVLLQAVQFDGTNIPLTAYTYPFGDTLNPALTSAKYRTYNLADSHDLWKLWHSRSRVYEQSLDLWWVRSYYYWDLPHRLFELLFLGNVLLLGTAIIMLLQESRKSRL